MCEGFISCPEAIESIKLGLRNRLYFSEHKPINALSAWWRSKRAKIVVKVSKIHLAEQVSQINLIRFRVVCFSWQDLVQIKVLGHRVVRNTK